MRLMTIAQSGANSDAGYISVNIRSTQFKKVRFEYIVMLFVAVSCCTLLTWPRCYSVCNSFSQVNQLFFSNIDDCMPKIAMWYVDIRCRYIGLDLSDADYDVLVVTSLGIYSFKQRIQEWRLSKCKSICIIFCVRVVSIYFPLFLELGLYVTDVCVVIHDDKMFMIPHRPVNVSF